MSMSTSENSNNEISIKEFKSDKKNEISNSSLDDDDLDKSPRRPLDKIREYLVLKVIGDGSFGSVFLVEKETNKKKYALKVINKDFLSRTERAEEALIERIILSRCKHPSIVRLSSSFQTKHKLFFVMEYCPNKDLNKLIRKLKTLEPNLAFQIICELVNVIDYLHNVMYISHNDLKPQNILLDANYHIKLIDFSTARIKDKIFDKKKGDFIPSDEYVTKDIIGTAEFISPEMVNQTVTDYRTNDIWSLGTIIYMIFNGESPFKDINDFQIIDRVKEGKFSYIKKDIPEDVVDLINNILVEDTSKRLNITQIKEHKYFKNKNVNWETVLNNKVPIDLDLLNKVDKLIIENSNNEKYWGKFCDDININTDILSIDNNFLIEAENDFKVERKKIIPKIINNFFYSKEKIESKIKEKGEISCIMKKCGFIEKEVKLIMNNKEKKIDIYDLEKNELIKKIELNEKTKIKLEKNNELAIDGEKFRSSKSVINNWINCINEVIKSK